MNNVYNDLYVDIRKKKYFLFLTVAIFLLATLLSNINVPELRKALLEVIAAIRKMAEEYKSGALFYVIVKIFAHNAVAMFLTLFSGILIFLIPLFSIAANGYLIGFVVSLDFSKIGLLVPHGIFELPAFALACAYGIWLGLWPFNHGRIETVKLRLKQCIKIYFYAVLPLLVAAAIIEGTLLKYM